jgi:SAM-dependent methyltransferase
MFTALRSYPPTVKIEAPRPPEQDIYTELWNRPEYRQVSPGERIVQQFLEVAKPLPGATILDLGCGTGRGSLGLYAFGGLDVTAVDFTPNCLDQQVRALVDAGKIKFEQADLTQPSSLKATYGFCTDVLEHIHPQDVDKVISTCLHACQHVFFQIATEDDVMGALVGQKLHLTVEPYEWWKAKFEEKECKIHWSKELPGCCLFYVSNWSDANELLEKTALNIESELVHKNVSINIKRGFQQVMPHPTNDVEIMLIGGSPSLAKNIEKIRELRQNGVRPIAMNGAYKYCLDNGIKPSGLVVLDARPHNVRFVEPVIEDCKYFIASQCDPALFDNLPAERTYIWHTAAENVKELLNEQYGSDWWPVPGGSTVLLRSIALFRMLGFKRIHIFGCDSCLDGDAHHAYDQKENDGQPALAVTVGTKIFYCHPWMISQAQEFINMIKMMGDEIELEVYDGLLHHILETGASYADLKE